MAMGPSMVSLYPAEGYRGSIVMELTNNVALCANSQCGNDVIVKALLVSFTG
jgi:hypothetical protein